MNLKRVGYVTDGLSSRNGTERYSRSLVEAVSSKVAVRVLTMHDAPNDSALTDVHAVLPHPRFHPLTQLSVAWKTFRYMRGCDVIHSLVEPYAPAVALAGFLLGVPVTMTLHGTYAIPPERASFKRLMMRFMYSRMPLTTTGSLHTERKVRQLLPRTFKECRMIPNGVNLERFHPVDGVQKENLILTVGMLKARKGVDTVLSALSELKKQFPALHYAVVGDDGHDAFSARVRQMVNELGLKDRVTFHERIQDSELLSLYNRAKVFVLAARETDDGAFEGFPMVFYEANACATPVISTRGFGSEYAIHEGENGLLVEQNDPHAVAEAIRSMFADEARYKRMQERSLEEAGKHTWDKIAEMLMNFYHDVTRLK
jgi:phosphatidylinositol alpha-1,6-mannosyltransferase